MKPLPLPRPLASAEYDPPGALQVTDGATRGPAPLQLEAPLNLSVKVSLSISEPWPAPSASSCPTCGYRTAYPEVLTMHRRLAHKERAEPAPAARRSGPLSTWKHRRFTGCPPALKGHDVSPLPTLDRRHPRRTKSPPPQPQAPPPRCSPVAPLPQEKLVAPPPRRSPAPVATPPQPQAPPLQEKPAVAPPPQDGEAPHPQEPSRFMELVRKPGSAPRPAGPAPSVRGGVTWRDAARLCLSGRFSGLDPPGKRLKITVPPGRDAPGSMAPSVAMETGVKLGGAGPVGGGLDSDWTMMNLLSCYRNSDLAALYAAPPPPRTGKGHLPNDTTSPG